MKQIQEIENAILFWLFDHKDGFVENVCWFYAPIIKDLKIDKEILIGFMKSLKKKGFVVYEKGLWSDDGSPAGSGHRITHLGEEYLNSLQTFKGDEIVHNTEQLSGLGAGG